MAPGIRERIEQAVLISYLADHGYSLESVNPLPVPAAVIPKRSFANMLAITISRYPQRGEVLAGFAVALQNFPCPNLDDLLAYADTPEMVQKIGYVLDGFSAAYRQLGITPPAQAELQHTIAALEGRMREGGAAQTAYFLPLETEADREFFAERQDDIGKKWNVADIARVGDYVRALELYTNHSRAKTAIEVGAGAR